MPSANERLLETALNHAVDLAQYSTGVVRRMIGVLNGADADLVAALAAALERVDSTTFNVQRLESMLGSVRSVNAQAYQRVGRELDAELLSFMSEEWPYQMALFPSVGVVATLGPSITAAQIYAATTARPFQGRLLSEWSKSLEEGRLLRIRDAVRIGYIEGRTTDEIVRKVRGTRASSYSDGIMQMDRRDAEAVVRTAVQHTAAGARDEMFKQNESVIKSLSWTSTLDTRTTPSCRIRDGKLYSPKDHAPIGHKIPWLSGPGRLHWRCRSTAVAVTKSFSELLGIPGIEEPKGARESLDGQVPAELSYGQWLKKQSATRQDEVVGPTRGTLMREGKLPFDALYTPRGEYLTLEQLRERNASAFKRAGL